MFSAPLRPAPPSPSVERSLPPARPPMPLSPKPKYSTEPPLQQQLPSKFAESEPEEDAWTQFKKLTEKATIAVKSTEERLKELEKTTAAKDIKDESYLAQIGYVFLKENGGADKFRNILEFFPDPT